MYVLVLSQLASWRTSSIVKCGYQIHLGQISLWFMTIECYRNKYCTLANTWNILSSINLFKTFISVTWKNELFITLDLVFQRGKNSKNGAENHYSIDFFCNFQVYHSKLYDIYFLRYHGASLIIYLSEH